MNTATRGGRLARVAVLACCSTAVYAGLYRIRTFDTLFHLAAGRYILEQGRLPDRDSFSFTYAGAEWTNHSGLFQIMLAGLQRVGGFEALSLYQALTALLLVGLGSWSMRRAAEGERMFAAWLMAAPCIAFREVLEARPHVIGFVCLALCLLVVMHAERTGAWRWLAAVIPIYAVWAASHGSHVLIYPMLALALGCALYLRAYALLAGLAACALLCLLLMARIAPWAFSQGVQHASSLFLEASVTEWRPLRVQDVLGSWPGRLFMLAWSLSVLGLVAASRDRAAGFRLYPALLLIGCLLLALGARRMIALFLFGAAPLWLPYAVRGASWCTGRIRRLLPPARAGWSTLLCLLGFVVLWAAGHGQRATFVSGAGLHAERFPIESVRALRAAGGIRRVYNAYNFGGYLMFEGVPVFVDGRAITVYPAEFLAEFQRAYSDPAAFEALSRRFACDGVLLPVDSPLAMRLRAHLQASPAWKRVHRDTVAELYARAPAP